MIHRLFAILLTLAVPLQGFAVPHCHGESVAGQPTDHHQSPHFHFGHGHHHGDHGHAHHHDGTTNVTQNRQETPSPAEQHDDDAIYVTSDLAVGKMQVRMPTLDASLPVATVADHTIAIQRASFNCLAAPPDYGVEHIFLATASLRL